MQLYMLSGHDKASEVFNFLIFVRELSHQQQKHREMMLKAYSLYLQAARFTKIVLERWRCAYSYRDILHQFRTQLHTLWHCIQLSPGPVKASFSNVMTLDEELFTILGKSNHACYKLTCVYCFYYQLIADRRVEHLVIIFNTNWS